jgi:uncharacterized protein YecE (DUF72 family)
VTGHRIRVGISGWRYPPWRGVFYPPGLRLAYDHDRLDGFLALLPRTAAAAARLAEGHDHGDTELYTSGYSDAALEQWAGRVRAGSEQAEALVSFDNDVKVRAPHDAMRLADLLGVTAPTRVAGATAPTGWTI